MSGKLAITTQPTSDITPTALLGSAAAQCLDNISERHWATSLTDCCADGKKKCLIGFLCWPCMECLLADRMGECPGLGCIPGGILAMRVKTRTLFGIKGSICRDCLATTLCAPCAICQISRELDKAGL